MPISTIILKLYPKEYATLKEQLEIRLGDLKHELMNTPDAELEEVKNRLEKLVANI